MALSKQIMSPSGVEAQYHKITLLNYDRITQKLRISLASYKDQSCRENNKSPLAVKQLQFNGSELDHSQPLFPQIYQMIKSLPDFENSQDV